MSEGEGAEMTRGGGAHVVPFPAAATVNPAARAQSTISATRAGWSP